MRYERLRLKAAVSMLGLIGLLAALLVVAGGAQAASVTTLKLSTVTTGQPAMDPIIASFNQAYASKNIRVEASYAPAASWGQLTLTQFQAKNAPDLLMTTTAASAPWGTWRLAAQNRLLDLSRSSWVKKEPKFLGDRNRYKGRTYAYQMGFNPSGMIYNRSLFKSMNIAIPKTFGQLLSMCRKIAGEGKIPIAVGTAGGAINATVSLGNMVIGNSVFAEIPNWSLRRERGQVKFATSPQWRRALQQHIDMKNAKCFPPSPTAVTVAQQFQMLASGAAAMMPGVTLELTAVKAINPKVPLSMFALPAQKAATTRVWLGPSQLTLAANADTKNAFAAKQFINDIARPDVTRRFSTLVWDHPKHRYRASASAVDLEQHEAAVQG